MGRRSVQSLGEEALQQWGALSGVDLRRSSPEVVPPIRGVRSDPTMGSDPSTHYMHWGRVQELLEGGANPNEQDEHGWTALHYAAEDGVPEAVKALIDARADVEATNVDGAVPLHHAAFAGHLDVVNVLLKEGANISVTNRHGFTPIDFAEATGPVAEVLRAAEREMSRVRSPEPRDNDELLEQVKPSHHLL